MATVRKRTRIAANGEAKTAWVADYFDQDRKRHLKTFSNKKAAKAWLLETEGEVKDGIHTPERSSINVAAAAQLWLDHCEAEGHERGTMKSYRAVVALHVVPTLGAVKLARLSTPYLEGWRDRILTSRSRIRAGRTLMIVKMILKEAQRRGLVAQNVAAPVKIEMKARDKKKLEVGVDIPSKAQIQRLLVTAAEPRWARHRPFLVTAIFAGMRVSELRGLPKTAVDFDKRTITVRRRADEWGTLGMPKTHAGRREIPMSPTVFNTLREHRLAVKGELMFPTTTGTVQRLGNFEGRVWLPLQKAAGLVDDETGKPLFKFHALRHFAASMWIELGFTPKRLQSLLGHASIEQTFDTYGHLFPSPEDDLDKFAKGEIGLVG